MRINFIKDSWVLNADDPAYKDIDLAKAWVNVAERPYCSVTSLKFKIRHITNNCLNFCLVAAILIIALYSPYYTDTESQLTQ